MHPESRFAISLTEEIGSEIQEEVAKAPFQIQSRSQSAAKTTKTKRSKRREAKLDTISAAVVVGLTALFVVFILGLVTEFAPRIIETVLLSVVIGLCVGVIAFALMKNDD